ncbi:hypothetical protein CRUP_008871, partial [Coryphaenoides rupestris]
MLPVLLVGPQGSPATHHAAAAAAASPKPSSRPGGILDLAGEHASFSRSLRGPKPRAEPSKMGKCDGRCTLLAVCSLQL